jgi:hypothetical protein
MLLRRHARLAWLPLCLAAGLLSVSLGQDASWDLQNYHLYNAFALFHPHRHDIDIAQSQSFLNPLLDIPLYALIVAFPRTPQLIAFVMGLPFGLLAFITLRMTRRLFGTENHTLACVAALLGLTGTATAAQLGLSTNEIPVAALVIAGFDCLLLAIRDEAAARPLLLAGLLTGLAVGAKLTAAPYAIGLAAAACVAVPPRRLPKALFIIGAAGAGGVLCTGGAWLAHLYLAYGNPILPYDNQIFNSPWAGPWGYEDVRFFPRATLQWLFYPFWWARDNVMVVTEAPFADPRLAVLFAALPFVLLAALTRRRLAALIPPPPWRAVIVFWLVSYVGWERLFSIYRYAIPLEILGAALIIGALITILPARPRSATAALLTAAICAASTYPNWGRVPFQGASLPARMPPLPSRSLVISTGDFPVSFLALRAPRGTVFIGANSNFTVPDTTLTFRAISAAIAAWRGPIEIIEPVQGDPTGRDILAAEFNIAATSQCRQIIAAWNFNALRLCVAQRVESAPDDQPAISFGFTAADAAQTYLRGGWAPPESFGRWTNATDATIVLPLNPANTRRLRLTVLAFSIPGRHVAVYANGRLVAYWATAGFAAQTYQATIPPQAGAARLMLRFHIPDANTPYRPSNGGAQPLGLAAMHLSLQEILPGA